MTTRALADIAHTLESADDSSVRIRRALVIFGDLVPFRLCALLTVFEPAERAVVVPGESVPDVSDYERSRLVRKMQRLLRPTETPYDSDQRPQVGQLMLPIVGLDRVIGVLRVEPPEGLTYGPEHVSLLSIVGAQLGAYLTTLELRNEQARRLRDLQSAHDYQRLLMGVVGHDLRAPLGVIQASAAMLEHDPGSTARCVARIERSVRRATKIVEDLLDLTQVQLAGGVPLRRRRTDLQSLTEEIVHDVQTANPGRTILFQSAAIVEADCDAERIVQVLTNLLTNALKHGSPKDAVRVDLTAQEDVATISVRNAGKPIAPALLAHIFDPFKRGPAGGTDGRGLGLGLYIVAEIVRGHGGRIVARSDEQETCFTVTLPGETGDAKDAAPFSKVAPSSQTKTRS